MTLYSAVQSLGSVRFFIFFNKKFLMLIKAAFIDQKYRKKLYFVKYYCKLNNSSIF